MFGQVLGGIASTLVGGLMNKGNSTPEAIDNSFQTSGLQSSLQGSNVPPATPVIPKTEGALAIDLAKNKIQEALSGLGTTAMDALGDAGRQGASALTGSVIDKLFGKTASDKGQDTRDYLANAFPELNPWERAGAGASMSGVESSAQDNAKELMRMQLDNAKDIAHIQADNQYDIAKLQTSNATHIAGINSATSRMNTKDQVFAQNEMLKHNKAVADAKALDILQNTNLSKAQQARQLAEITRTNLEAQGVELKNSQIPILTKKYEEEVTNARYGSSWFGATAKDAGNLINDAARSFIGSFNPSDVTADQADTFSKAGGVTGAMSRKVNLKDMNSD